MDFLLATLTSRGDNNGGPCTKKGVRVRRSPIPVNEQHFVVAIRSSIVDECNMWYRIAYLFNGADLTTEYKSITVSYEIPGTEEMRAIIIPTHGVFIIEQSHITSIDFVDDQGNLYVLSRRSVPYVNPYDPFEKMITDIPTDSTATTFGKCTTTLTRSASPAPFHNALDHMVFCQPTDLATQVVVPIWLSAAHWRVFNQNVRFGIGGWDRLMGYTWLKNTETQVFRHLLTGNTDYQLLDLSTVKSQLYSIYTQTTAVLVPQVILNAWRGINDESNTTTLVHYLFLLTLRILTNLGLSPTESTTTAVDTGGSYACTVYKHIMDDHLLMPYANISMQKLYKFVDNPAPPELHIDTRPYHAALLHVSEGTVTDIYYMDANDNILFKRNVIPQDNSQPPHWLRRLQDMIKCHTTNEDTDQLIADEYLTNVRWCIYIATDLSVWLIHPLLRGLLGRQMAAKYTANYNDDHMMYNILKKVN